VQSSSQIVTVNKPTSNFLQAGCPSCRPTNSVKALKGKISHSMDLLTPSSHGGFPTLSLTTRSSCLPWGRVAMPLFSPLTPVLQEARKGFWPIKKLGVGSLMLTIWLELCTCYRSSCHHSPPPSSIAPTTSRVMAFWRRLTQGVLKMAINRVSMYRKWNASVYLLYLYTSEPLEAELPNLDLRTGVCVRWFIISNLAW